LSIQLIEINSIIDVKSMEYYDVLIKVESLEELRKLDTFDLDIKRRAARQESEKEYSIPGILTKPDIDKLASAGYVINIVRDLTPISLERQSQVSRINRFADLETDAIDDSLTIQGYLTNEEIDSAISVFASSNSGIVTRIELPFLTWEGRRSFAVRLHAGTNTLRTGVLFTGGMHAREWGGADICIAFMLLMVNSYKNNLSMQFGGKVYSAIQVKQMMEELDIFIFPNINPDGRNYSQNTYTWWRKNRNPNGNGPAGVDLNRNFDFLWNSGIGTSSSQSSETYKGSAPFSEPETKNVKYLFDSYSSIRYYLDIHSYSGLILYNWGIDNNQNIILSQNFLNNAFDGLRGVQGDSAYREFISTLDENTLKGLTKRMHDALQTVRGKNYLVEQSMGLYPTSATSCDYSLSRNFISASNQKVYGFTIEFGDEFIPPITEMNLIKSDINAAMSELCLAACSDIYLADNEVDDGSVPSSTPFWNSPDIWIRNNDDSGTIHQNTIRGRDNYLYIRVRNRGTAEALNVKVRAYITTWAGTEFIHPVDWIPKNPGGGGSITSAGTYLIGENLIATLLPTDTQIIKMKWQASLIPEDVNWHPCILVEVSPNDGPFSVGPYVWNNNNLAQKNITIVNASASGGKIFPFLIGRAFGTRKLMSVELQKVKCPTPIRAGLVFEHRAEIEIKAFDHFKLLREKDKIVYVLDPGANIGRITFIQTGASRIPVKLAVEIPKMGSKKYFLFELIQSDSSGRKVGGLLYQINLTRLVRQGEVIPLKNKKLQN
jgi:carboxypeptidase T